MAEHNKRMEPSPAVPCDHVSGARLNGNVRPLIQQRGSNLHTPIFAVSRMSGWTAHILEQYANNRLIRPRADYAWPSYPQRFVPLEQR